VLPDNFKYDFEDLDIGFLRDATHGACMRSQNEDVDFLEK
jgi:hypothetical protein